MMCKFERCEAGGQKPICCCKACGNKIYASDPSTCYAECKKGPSTLQKLKNFSTAAVTHVLCGAPQSTPEQMEERFAICKACKWYRPSDEDPEQGVCKQTHCGCNIKAVGKSGLNKLAWADQSCPIGLWGRVDAKVTGTNNTPF